MADEEWQIEATLLDNDGNPANLTNVDLDWFLLDQANSLVINGEGVRIDVKDRADGKCCITVASEVTAKIAPGLYSDRIRLTLHSGKGRPVLLRATVWEGVIEVKSTDRWVAHDQIACI
jgi:hypothetical protein